MEGCLAGTPWDSLRIELGTAPARVRRQEWTPPTVRNPPWLSGTLLASVYRILAKVRRRSHSGKYQNLAEQPKGMGGKKTAW